ncbi:hypothetical protein C8J57DRAFT_1612484 [Mycena rebaudengoi]|nr:hypothetical protein C8J57DRAFT_1612484 [Mycena rebaudengoi]
MPDAVPPPPPPAPGPAASLKRKLDETIAELGDKNRKRAKRANPTSTRSPMERFLYAAKLFARGLNPHIYFPSVLDGGAASLWQPEPAANVDHSDPEELERVKEFIDAFTAFMVTLPADCREVLKSVYLSEDDTHWPSMVSKLKAAATGARTNDTNGLKHALHYFLEDPSNDQLNPPIHKTDLKSDRGLNHPMLRLFLLPCKYRRVIETLNNPGIVDTLADGIDIDQIAPELLPPKMLLERLLSGAVPIEADHFPSFLYANGACNPDDLAEGLLRGEPFVRVVPAAVAVQILRHLWTGPSSVLGPVAKEIPKGCNADTHEARKITPGICGVAACQGRTMLSTKDWGVRDGGFESQDLFDSVVGLFSDPTHPWAVETLAYLQRRVFGDAKTSATSSGPQTRRNAAAAILSQRSAPPPPPPPAPTTPAPPAPTTDAPPAPPA